MNNLADTTHLFRATSDDFGMKRKQSLDLSRRLTRDALATPAPLPVIRRKSGVILGIDIGVDIGVKLQENNLE
jgi:hypothetical protein